MKELWIREDEEKRIIARLKDDIDMPIRYERLSYDNIGSPLLLGFRRYALKRNNFGSLWSFMMIQTAFKRKFERQEE